MRICWRENRVEFLFVKIEIVHLPATGPQRLDDARMDGGPDPRNNPAAKEVVAEFKAKNFDPEAYTLYSYAAVQIIKQAAEKAKSLDPKKVAAAMHSGMTFNTVIGADRL